MPIDLLKDLEGASTPSDGPRDLIDNYEKKQGVAVDPSNPKDLLDTQPAAKPYQEYPERNAGISGLIGEVGEAIYDMPKHMLGSFARAYQGTEPYTKDGEQGISDHLIKLSEEQAAARRREPDSNERVPFFGTKGEVSGDTGSSLGFSAANMAAGGLAGVGAALATGNPIAGYVAGAGVSGTAAYRMAANQFLRDTIEAEDALSREEGGPGLSNEERVKRQEELNQLATEYGLYEAIPEAASNVAGLKILTTPLKKMLGNKVGTKVLAKLGSFYGQELATETVTGMGQQRVEAELDPAEQARQFDDIDAWAETFKEVAPQTILLSTIMGGTAAGIAKVHQKTISDPQKAAAYKDAATRPDQLALLPDKELDRLIEQGQEVSGRRKNDVELKTAIGALSNERKRRAAADQQKKASEAGFNATVLLGKREDLDKQYQNAVYNGEMDVAKDIQAQILKVEKELDSWRNAEIDEIEAAPAPADPDAPLGPEYDDVSLAEPLLGEAEGIDVGMERPLTSQLAERFQQRVQEYRQRAQDTIQRRAEEQIQVEEVSRGTEGERLARENNALIEAQRQDEVDLAAERERAILPTAQVVELSPEEVEAGVIDEIRPSTGEPYRSEKSAANMAKIRKLENYVPVEKDGGWVLQRKRGTDAPLPDLTQEAAGVEVTEIDRGKTRVPGGSQLMDALKGAGVATEPQKTVSAEAEARKAELEKEFPPIKRQAGLPEPAPGAKPKEVKRQAGFGETLPDLEPTAEPKDGTPDFLQKKTQNEILYGKEEGSPPETGQGEKSGKSGKSGKTATLEPKTGKNDVSQPPAPLAPPTPVASPEPPEEAPNITEPTPNITTKDRRAALKSAGYRTSGSAADVAQRHADMEEARALFKDYTTEEQISADIKSGKLDPAQVARLANAATSRNYKNSETEEVETRALGGGAHLGVLITRLRAMGIKIQRRKVYPGVEGKEYDRMRELAKKGGPLIVDGQPRDGRRTIEEEREYQGLSAKDKALREGKDIEQAEDARDEALKATPVPTELEGRQNTEAEPAAVEETAPADEVPTNRPAKKAGTGSVIGLLKNKMWQEAYELAKAKGNPLRFTKVDNDVKAVAYADDMDSPPYGREAFSGQTEDGAWVVVDDISGVTINGPYDGNSRGKALEATRDRPEWKRPWQQVQESFSRAGKKSQHELETMFVAKWGGEPPPPPPKQTKPKPSPGESAFKPYIVKTTDANHFDRRKTVMVEQVEGGGEVTTNAEVLYSSSERRLGVLNALGECFNAS